MRVNFKYFRPHLTRSSSIETAQLRLHSDLSSPILVIHACVKYANPFLRKLYHNGGTPLCDNNNNKYITRP